MTSTTFTKNPPISMPQEPPQHIREYFSGYSRTKKQIPSFKFRFKLIRLFLIGVILNNRTFSEITNLSPYDFLSSHSYTGHIRKPVTSLLESILKNEIAKNLFISQWKNYLDYFLPVEKKGENFPPPALEDLGKIEKINEDQQKSQRKNTLKKRSAPLNTVLPTETLPSFATMLTIFEKVDDLHPMVAATSTANNEKLPPITTVLVGLEEKVPPPDDQRVKRKSGQMTGSSNQHVLPKFVVTFPKLRSTQEPDLFQQQVQLSTQEKELVHLAEQREQPKPRQPTIVGTNNLFYHNARSNLPELPQKPTTNHEVQR